MKFKSIKKDHGWGDVDAGSENYKIENGIESIIINQVKLLKEKF